MNGNYEGKSYDNFAKTGNQSMFIMNMSDKIDSKMERTYQSGIVKEKSKISSQRESNLKSNLSHSSIKKNNNNVRDYVF